MEFYYRQDKDMQDNYIKLLKIMGSLSRLFADSSSPYLHYRVMENIFCKSFEAMDYSRSDISADAGKKDLGIGLKTFLHNNGRTLQKIAEFNRDSAELKDLSNKNMIYRVAEMRNKRIESTKSMCNLDRMIYHVVTRSDGYMGIYEENMDLINLKKINITNVKKTTITFNDGINEYNFNISKSTLLKRFITSKENMIYGFKVEILEDPYDFLISAKNEHKELLIEDKDVIEDYIILPLYSTRLKKVAEKSGLNFWNAGGRPRKSNEAYIPIPKWIHDKKKDFFPYTEGKYKVKSFDVKLPNGKILDMNVSQEGGKALMSNPNEDLGYWILREILKIRPGVLVTMKDLNEIGIDSVKLSKNKEGLFLLDFAKSGTYEKFEEENNV